MTIVKLLKISNKLFSVTVLQILNNNLQSQKYGEPLVLDQIKIAE